MAARSGPNNWRWWCLAGLLAGCVQPTEGQPAGTFGQARKQLFDSASPTLAESSPVVEPVTEGATGRVPEQPVASGQPVVPEQPVATGAPSPTTSPAAHEAAVKPTPTAVPTAAIARSVTPGLAAPRPATATLGKPRIRTERELRNAYATATDPSDAAIDLAGFLVRGERYAEALHVVDQALGRSQATALRITRAGLLRDVARCDLAATELLGVVRELGLEGVGPTTLFALAQVQWVAGQPEAARDSLRSLNRLHASSPWFAQHKAEVQDWHDRIENHQAGRDLLANGAMRDLFALLRAAPVPTARLRLLERLATPPAGGREGGRQQHDDRRAIRIRAIAVACGDESAAVRTRAVQLAAKNQLSNLEFWQAALGDVAALVRRTAAGHAAKQHGAVAVPALLAAVTREQDPGAFAALHRALSGLHASAQEPEFGFDTAAGRSAAVAYWKEQFER